MNDNLKFDGKWSDEFLFDGASYVDIKKEYAQDMQCINVDNYGGEIQFFFFTFTKTGTRDIWTISSGIRLWT